MQNNQSAVNARNMHVYRPDIDGLRAIAVLAVVIYHAFPSLLGGGFIGVDIFFVISGFLITGIILRNSDCGGFSIVDFYKKRVRRIVPALAIVLLFTLVVGWCILLADELNQLGNHIAGGAAFVSNFVLWRESGYFDVSAHTKPLLHLWSLAIEEQFYILWPLFLWFVWLRNGKPWLIGVLLFVFIAFSFSLNYWGVYKYPTATFFLPVTRAWELLAGAFGAWGVHYRDFLSSSWLMHRVKNFYRESIFSSQVVLSDAASLAGFLLLCVGLIVVDKSWPYPGPGALIPVWGSLLLILAGPNGYINRKLLTRKWLVVVGLISYPLYLWHWPLLAFGNIVYLDGIPVVYAVVCVFLSLVLAWLTYRFIEIPIRTGSQKGSASSSGVLVLICLSLMGLGLIGLVFGRLDFTKTHTADNLSIERKGAHAIGASLAWFQGKHGWLFLGNAYDRTIAKLKFSVAPDVQNVEAIKTTFSRIASSAEANQVDLFLLVGPDKHSVYPEYLPDEIAPSKKRYVSVFLDKLTAIDGLKVYDPINDLLAAKRENEYLYWATDTHWNDKGAFVAFSGLSSLMGTPTPKVSFALGSPRAGDLIKISKKQDHPLVFNDNWQVRWDRNPIWVSSNTSSGEGTSFGSVSVTRNDDPLSAKTVWIVGDSFSESLRKYFSATFREVHFIGHWSNVLHDLPDRLDSAVNKPDLIVIVRVERSF